MYSDRYYEGRSSRSRSDDYMGESKRGSYSSYSSSNSRSRWYSEVPVLGSFLRTMKGIFGFHGYSERYHEIETGKRRRSRQSSRPSNTHFEEEYYLRRPSQAKLQKNHNRRRTQDYHSPGPNNPLRWPNTYHIKSPFPYQYPSRSSSTSSYIRPRPQIIDRPPTNHQPRKRKVSFTDPLETPIPPTREYTIRTISPRPQKRPSIDDQNGSRKRVPLEILTSHSNPSSYQRKPTRSPRPHSPVIERIPSRRGKRISPMQHFHESESPDIQYIPARENRHSTNYTENIEIIDRGPLSSPTYFKPVNFSRPGYKTRTRTPSNVESGRYDLDARSWRVLNESTHRRPSHHRECEVCRV